MPEIAQSEWVDRFAVRLSRLQFDISPDMLVDLALVRWSALAENVSPETSAEQEFGDWRRAARPLVQ